VKTKTYYWVSPRHRCRPTRSSRLPPPRKPPAAIPKRGSRTITTFRAALSKHVIVNRLTPGGTGLAFHRAKKEKEAWEVEERAALLQQEKANMASELQAMEDSTAAAAHQGDDA
jgi:hypothetical protein